ncbi:hypothetical protein [Symbioplanes lichenis]|uniref:hypothetical protein n=1 Tax=Symbioplanes lichenis TaxID=1629072 RepID=UPI0027396CE2|nr:hypothetical protein [Actinoplanes lichenis]
MRLRHRAAVVTAVAGIALTGLAAAGPAMAATATAGVNVDGGTSVKVDANVALPFVSAGSVAAVTTTTVTVKLPTGATSVIPVDAKAAVSLDGRKVALTALPPGATVVVTGTATGGVRSAKLVAALSRWSLNLSGTVSAVDAAKGTVTVNTTSGATVKLNVDPKATVTVNGAKVSLANLPIGATVGLTGTGTTTGGTAVTISAKR